jgi:16S rRNA (cytosine1402-N4)-methyltransferase
MKHIPVLLQPVLDAVKNISARDGVFVDGTFGRGGHTGEILQARRDLVVLGLDCDADAIAYGEKEFSDLITSGRLVLRRANFTDMKEALNSIGKNQMVGALLDLGVSSPQLDEGPRGFSFYHEGPLDMRMDQRQEVTAADIVNTWDEDGLNDLFKQLGEIHRPYRVTERILEQRKQKPFSTTRQLAELIEKAMGWRQKGFHPATQFFMALRLEVNQELARLEKILPAMVSLLVPGGRLLVITFHSLEDRIVKVGFKKLSEEGFGQLVNKKVIQATWDEKKINPRARSAKLRIFERSESKGTTA